jgi:hypothetical protein
MLGRNAGTEGFEENMVENVREKCWDGRVGREDEMEKLKEMLGMNGWKRDRWRIVEREKGWKQSE